MLRYLLVLLLSLAGPSLALGGEAVRGLAGSWHGTVVEQQTESTRPAEAVEIDLDQVGHGFAVRLRLAGQTMLDARFAPADRPGVYEAVASGIFSMFSARRAGNPLKGEELFWAREDPGSLHLYRLTIPGSGLLLEHVRLEVSGKQAALSMQRREGIGESWGLTAMLSRGER